VVGWFLAHTRGPLTLTDREVDLCDHFFAHPGMLTVLVKPERFQPTRFGFLVRGADGSLARDGVANAIILPLPGRNSKPSAGPVASIPAPTVNTSAARRAVEAESPAEEHVEHLEVVAPPSAPAAPAAAVQLPSNRTARRQKRLSIEQVRPKEGEDLEATEPTLVPSRPAAVSPVASPTSGEDLEPLHDRAILDRPAAVRPSQRRDQELDATDTYRQMELLNQKRPVSATARMVLILPLAALFGCLVGWLAFKQVPPPIIPLAVKARGENLVVTWPAEQTRSAISAFVRVDDGMPVPLTPEEKSTGRVEVQARPDMKLELTARNWLRDSQGIVHYVRPVANTAP